MRTVTLIMTMFMVGCVSLMSDDHFFTSLIYALSEKGHVEGGKETFDCGKSDRLFLGIFNYF